MKGEAPEEDGGEGESLRLWRWSKGQTATEPPLALDRACDPHLFCQTLREFSLAHRTGVP